ncbi:hypothetical protein P2G88_08930 [Aliiglaciecola sp. CAU 1673]|uniref:hypothetical protein n=1 Tax=Aliiglaciecola sp. CAU 1673 TaxID=3032595 RepID=UPI0023DAEBC3|nr:hypothetical protein [Aliiglaciecola sp. CAU 1673]MDF2178374.1 hypothetical protein [Aliiglaciecola sp. CAU 1673]
MLEAIVGIFSSSGLGAIVGLFGSWLTKREERRNMALKLEFEVKMAEIRKAEAEMEFNHELALADKQIERAQVEGEIQRDVAEMAAFKESLKEQQQMYEIKFVDAVRGLMRPLITVYLLIIATYVTLKIGGFVGGMEGAMPEQEMVIMYKDTIAQVMFLVTTAVTWWFGSRPSSQRKG